MVQCSLCGNRSPIDGGNPETLITNDKVLKIVETLSKNQENMDFQIQNAHGMDGEHNLDEGGDYQRQTLQSVPYTQEDEERLL